MKKTVVISLLSLLVLNSCVSKKKYVQEIDKRDKSISENREKLVNSQKELETIKKEKEELQSQLGNKIKLIKQQESEITESKDKLTVIENTKSGEFFKFNSLKNTNDSMSYFIGNDLINNLNRSGIKMVVSELALIQGIRDGSGKDKKLLIDSKTGQELATRLMQKAQAKRANSGEFSETIKKGRAFLNKKSKEKGVVTLKSGLLYKILTKGTGKIPKITNKISAHYHGTLIDGKVFDSSVERGKPFVTKVNQVIKGWVEALQLMPVGSKWELYIPYNLAYGERGAGGDIGPYETLIFQVEFSKL